MKISYLTGENIKDPLYTSLIRSEDIELVCLENRNPDLWGKKTGEAVPWVSPNEAAQLFKAGKIDRFVINPEYGWHDMCMAFLEKEHICQNREQICYLPKNWTEGRHSVTANDLEVFGLHYSDLLSSMRPLKYLEYHLTDHCNLNCACCCHFSPLVSGQKFIPPERVERDFTLLQKFVDHIWQIRVLGGEPLLHPQWKEHLALTKQFWPFAEIHLVTNGILLFSLQSCDLDFFRKNRIIIDLSLYPPMRHRLEEFLRLFKTNGVEYRISRYDYFSPLLNPDSRDDYREKAENCTMWCLNLRDGMMTRCPILMYIPYFNAHYHTDYPEDEPIRLEDVKDYEDLVEKLGQPAKLCSQCIYFNSFGADINSRQWQPWRQYTEGGDPVENGWENRI